MWRSLRNVLPKSLIGRLAVLSTAFHLFCLAALFLSGEAGERVCLDLTKVYDPQAKIVLLPFYKVAPKELNARHNKGSGGKGNSTVYKGIGKSASRSYGISRPATTLVYMGVSKEEKLRLQKKQRAEKKRLAKIQAQKKAKLLKKQQERKRKLDEKKAKLQEDARKKAERKKALEEKKKIELESAASAQIKEASDEKHQELPQQAIEIASTSIPEDGDGKSGGDENIIYVGRDEIDGYRDNAELCSLLAEVWHPPFGFEPESPCSFEVSINKNGSPDRIVLEASSGILVYDSAAQAALYDVSFPERFHGHVIHITFK